MIEYKSYLYSGNSLNSSQAITTCGGGTGLSLSITVPSTANYNVDDYVFVSGLGDADPGLNEKVRRFNGIAKVNQIFSGTVLKINKTVQYDIPTTFGTISKMTAVEVFPFNLKNCFKTKALQQNDFFYREKLQGSVKFSNSSIDNIADYNYLSAIEDSANRCSLFLIKILRKCDPTQDFEIFFNGKFTLNDGTWDRDSCFYETEIETDDIYSCLLDNNQDINILDVETTVETKAPLEIDLEFITCNSGLNLSGLILNNIVCPAETYFPVVFPDPGGNPFSTNQDASCITPGEWQVYENRYSVNIIPPPPYSVNIITTWFREKTKTLNVGGLPNSPPGDNWYSGAATDIGGLDATWWYRVPYDGAFNTYKWTTNCGLNETYETVELPDNPTTYSRNRWLFEALEYVGRLQCGAIKGVKSDFFEWNPVGDTPGYVPGINYVTGLANQYNLLTIAQKSDIVTPISSEAATLGMVKLKVFVEFIKEMFNVGWWVTADNYIRFEHVSVINKVPGIDFTVLDGGKWIKRNNKYTWKKDGMASIETYFWAEAGFPDFLGLPITYSAECLNKKDNSEKRHDATIVTTDLKYIQNNPTTVSKTGFFILANEETSPGSGIYIVIKDTGVLTQQDWNNAPLSWANLHDNLHRHYRIFITGKMNGFQDTFLSVQRFKAQKEFSYLDCCKGGLGEEITTQLGAGWLENLSLSLKSTETTISLIFE